MVARSALVRLDELLVRQGHAASREKAKALVLAGSVRLPTGLTPKPGLLVRDDLDILVLATPRYVSRGGEKLSHGLDAFEISVEGRVCADFGASTGGFSDCLLQRGALRIYAVDVGYGQLDWKIRQDPRVVTLERTNARYLESLPEPVDLVTIDASFISARLLLPAARNVASEVAEIVVLIKPQFEAGRERVGKGGVVKDPTVHRAVLEDTGSWLESNKFSLVGLTASPLLGPAGNVEFLAHVRTDYLDRTDTVRLIDDALEESKQRFHFQ
ncbi:MAG: TlyA family RNA methyltransferase [Chloroflexi bacterium]|nr:TlyA family RNA methyltransferase [Chloroflexota bacterium]